MSSSDARMFEVLAERVSVLEQRVDTLLACVGRLSEAVLGKDVSPELYGAAPDHGADREARAALLAKRRDRG